MVQKTKKEINEYSENMKELLLEDIDKIEDILTEYRGCLTEEHIEIITNMSTASYKLIDTMDDMTNKKLKKMRF